MPTLLFLQRTRVAAPKPPAGIAPGFSVLASGPRPRWSRLRPPEPRRRTPRRVVTACAPWPRLQLHASAVRVRTTPATAALTWAGHVSVGTESDGELLELIALGLV